MKRKKPPSPELNLTGTPVKPSEVKKKARKSKKEARELVKSLIENEENILKIPKEEDEKKKEGEKKEGEKKEGEKKKEGERKRPKEKVGGAADDVLLTVDSAKKTKRIVFPSSSSDDFMPNSCNPAIVNLRRPAAPLPKKKTGKSSKSQKCL